MVSDAPFNAAEIGLSIARVLEAWAVPYALGGALAHGVWALDPGFPGRGIRANQRHPHNTELKLAALLPQVLVAGGVVAQA